MEAFPAGVQVFPLCVRSRCGDHARAVANLRLSHRRHRETQPEEAAGERAEDARAAAAVPRDRLARRASGELSARAAAAAAGDRLRAGGGLGGLRGGARAAARARGGGGGRSGGGRRRRDQAGARAGV